MTGAAAAAAGAAAGAGNVTQLTIGTPDGNFFGFVTAGYGSVSPASCYGKAIEGVNCGPSFADLGITIADASLPQSFFRRITLVRTGGAIATFHTNAADAFFSTGSAVFWRWGTGSNRVWTATSPSPQFITFYR